MGLRHHYGATMGLFGALRNWGTCMGLLYSGITNIVWAHFGTMGIWGHSGNIGPRWDNCGITGLGDLWEYGTHIRLRGYGPYWDDETMGQPRGSLNMGHL